MSVRPARRRENLILLIVFIVLSVGLGVGLVVVGNERANDAKTIADLQAKLKDWVGSQEAAFAFELTEARATNRQVVQVIHDERLAIAKLLSSEDAIVQSNQLQAKVDGAKRQIVETLAAKEVEAQTITDNTIVTVAVNLAREVANLRGQLATARTALAEEQQKVAAGIATLGTIREDNTRQLGERDKQITALGDQMKSAEDAAAKLLADTQTNLQATIRQNEDEILSIRGELQAKDNELQIREKRIVALQRRIQELRPEVDPLKLLLQADGRVLRVVDQGNRVYISLGRNDRIPLGLTFEVYSAQTGFTANGQGKASIEIVSLNDTTAEARVTRSTPNDPILSGDLISNIVYDRTRSFSFAVLGEFDVDGNGLPDSEKVREWISLWGGKTSTRLVEQIEQPVVSEATDFLVLGAPPPRPQDPAPDDSAEERNRKLSARKAFDQYSDLRSQALALRIPVLTESQFLAYVGRPIMTTKQGASVDPRIRREILKAQEEGTGGAGN